ncbi:MAG: acyl-CoA thioesterase [Candidatus Kapabacteria bacterium]|nr:acyl-CoA thioesterase [Candidatus Kapabacteria bacterium]
MLQHTSTIRVRYAETDQMRVVYNGEYLTYFEVGRTEALRAFGLPYTELEKEGYLLPVIEAFIQYKSPAFYDDILEITASLSSCITATITISYIIRRKDILIAEGRTVHTFVHATTMKPARPPKSYRQMIDSNLSNLLHH